MSDLIRREDLVKELNAQFAVGDITREIANDILNHIPSVKPEQQKGRWSNYKDEHCCSVCKCVVISDCWDEDIRYDYCPYCGAKME